MEQQQARAAAHGYDIREAAEILDLPARRVRAWVRAGWIEPALGPGGAPRLSFRDVALLRRIRDLQASRVPPRRVRRALERLRAAGGSDLPLGLRADRGELVVREGDALWSPESGQYVFDFEVAAPGRVLELVAGAGRRAECARAWLEAAGELEARDPQAAREAYARALAADPSLADAYLNWGCLEHECGDPEAAEAHYRAALALRPDDPIAHFDLGVALEDRGRDAEARASYAAAVASDPAHAEAHFNLARLCERTGDPVAALRHWTAYRRLARD
jgi:tetratricopeptide (TPR) repeat protein